MNLNKLARKITLKEGGKVNLPIGQVKEVMKLLFIELAKLKPGEAQRTINRYKHRK